MKNSAIESTKKDADIYDIFEYRHAEQVIKDFPALIAICDQLIPILEEKKHYTAVFALLQSVHDSRVMLNMQFKYYNKIYNNKGKKDE